MIGVSRVAEQCSQQFSVVFEDVKFSLEQHGETIAQRAGMRELLMRNDMMFPLHALVVGHYQRLFAGKVMVGQTERHSSLAGYLAHRRFVKTMLPKQSNRSVEDLLLRRLAASHFFDGARIFGPGIGHPRNDFSAFRERHIEHVQYYVTMRCRSQGKIRTCST